MAVAALCFTCCEILGDNVEACPGCGGTTFIGLLEREAAAARTRRAARSCQQPRPVLLPGPHLEAVNLAALLAGPASTAERSGVTATASGVAGPDLDPDAVSLVTSADGWVEPPLAFRRSTSSSGTAPLQAPPSAEAGRPEAGPLATLARQLTAVTAPRDPTPVQVTASPIALASPPAPRITGANRRAMLLRLGLGAVLLVGLVVVLQRHPRPAAPAGRSPATSKPATTGLPVVHSSAQGRALFGFGAPAPAATTAVAATVPFTTTWALSCAGPGTTTLSITVSSAAGVVRSAAVAVGADEQLGTLGTLPPGTYTAAVIWPGRRSCTWSLVGVAR